MTPEQIASTYKGGVKVLRRLQAHGLHIFTDAELRARDERIIRAALWLVGEPDDLAADDWDHIIARAEVNQ